jgi:hypothetical protein
VARQVYRAGGTFCLAALNQSLKDVTASDVGPLSLPATFLWGAADVSRASYRKLPRPGYGLMPDSPVGISLGRQVSGGTRPRES